MKNNDVVDDDYKFFLLLYSFWIDEKKISNNLITCLCFFCVCSRTEDSVFFFFCFDYRNSNFLIFIESAPNTLSVCVCVFVFLCFYLFYSIIFWFWLFPLLFHNRTIRFFNPHLYTGFIHSTMIMIMMTKHFRFNIDTLNSH